MRRHSDSVLEYRVSKPLEWRRPTSNQVHHVQSRPFLSYQESFNSPAAAFIDFPDLTVTDSANSPHVEVREKNYYISPIDEGFANTEVVTDSNNRTDIHDESEEEEIFTATPLIEYDIFSEGLVNNNSAVNFPTPASNQIQTQPKSRGNFKPFNFKTAGDTDSDSESDDIFKLFPDTSSSDEEYFSSPSPYTGDRPEAGNLPFLDELGEERFDPIFKPPLNPLVSKRAPTATTTYLSEPNLVGSSFTLNAKSLGTDIDTTVKDKEQQKEPVTVAEGNVGTFCSTNVQSALLNKISKIFDRGIHTSFDVDFPKISLPRRVSRKESIFRVKPSAKLKEDMGNHTKLSYRKTFENDITADLENFETEVGRAFEESVDEGSVMPLLKQELQCKIQVKRLSRGEPELIIEPEEPKTYELRPDEIKKKNDRLEQNRKSARKSRSKARKHEKNLLKTIKIEMTENARLNKEITILKKIRDEYKEACDIHMKSCAKGNIK